MPQNHQKSSLLLACESKQSCRLISGHLQEYFNLIPVTDAEGAWESLLEHRDIALLICDLALTADPYGILERIREAQDNRLAATPVLLLVSENDSDQQRELAFQNGATDFINLPFASAELTARVRLHANLYVQHSIEPTVEMQHISAVNVLQQLSQENFFNSRVQQEISFSQRHRTNVSLCKLKLDNIKAIIAGFDKATAISVVQAVARIMQQILRREDSLCYLGNAEFCLLFPATNGIGAVTGVNRIIDSIASRRIRIAGKQVPATLSGAIHSCIATEETSLKQLFSILDAGVNEAIAAGGNQIVSSLPPGEERVLSLDRALKLINAGDTRELSSHVLDLLEAILPLIKFADQVLPGDLDSLCQQLRHEIDQQGSSNA